MPLDANRPDLTIGVVGTGAMGRGIVQVAASGGLNVLMMDARPGAADEARDFISKMIGRAVEKGSLFARIAAQKETLVERGVVAGGKRLISAQPQAPQSAPAPEPVATAAIAVAQPKPELNQQTRDDLTTMRVRLIEEDGSAREIADALEAMIADGLQSPVALRVLGEAYLKLGLVERAAAQFRQAMLYRRRGA